MRPTGPVLLALATLLAAPAAANHKKPITASYEVTAPVPYPVDGSSHCTDGVEGLTKGSKDFTLPDRGVLQIEMSGFLGDWVLELFDAKGRMLGQAAQLDPLNTAPVRKLTYKKGTPRQAVRIVACNVNGGPTAQVRYTFTYR